MANTTRVSQKQLHPIYDVGSVQKFLEKFELDIVEKGIREGVFKSSRRIPVRPGKLATTAFGRTVGPIINSASPFVIDYYGYCKKSKGYFDRAVKIINRTGNQPSSLNVITVHFEAIKDKHFHRLCPDDPAFLGHFFFVKRELANLRWKT